MMLALAGVKVGAAGRQEAGAGCALDAGQRDRRPVGSEGRAGGREGRNAEIADLGFFSDRGEVPA